MVYFLEHENMNKAFEIQEMAGISASVMNAAHLRLVPPLGREFAFALDNVCAFVAMSAPHVARITGC